MTMYEYGFFKVAACVPSVSVGNCNANAKSIIEMLDELSPTGIQLAVMPEMCVTAYTCGDLFHNRQLLNDAVEAVSLLVQKSICWPFVFIVGAPLLINNILYNCAIVIHQGDIKGIVPKSYIPNYNEFYEKRWWASGPKDTISVSVGSFTNIPFGTNQLFKIDEACLGIEICEDLWTPIPPSCFAAMNGAHIIANLSASDDLIGKYPYLKQLISQQSARCIAGYVYASAGFGESSTDLVFDGKTFIAENGHMLVQNRRWQNSPQYVITDIDIEAIEHDRMSHGSFHDCAVANPSQRYSIQEIVTRIPYNQASDKFPHLDRSIDSTPFVPPTDSAMADRCDEITNIQAAGLAKRLHFVKGSKLVVGISGGLDSTLALLVAAKAFDRLGLDRKGIIGITMPGFGTTERTKDNAWMLMEQIGITSLEIPIGNAVNQHFADIGHNPSVHDTTYENSQARERTQILMDVANQQGALVLGTGDLSELALGWATYNGDHMSMYGVNAGIPKTLVRYLVKYFANDPAFASSHDTLLDIVDTPISPELIPADENGNITQKTEDLVGPYELHDFFLYYTLRYGFTSKKILYLASMAFEAKYSNAEIEKWLNIFNRRFFSQQFKRSCLPDGPKVGSVCLSPRGDWRMPSDASSQGWIIQ